MKKSIIALMGLFMLVACNEDVYQEADQMNESGNVENNSGGMQANSVDPAIPYESPYDDFSTCCSAVIFDFNNKTDLDLYFDPYVGLARYDGAYDNIHFSWGIPLTAALYPNIISNETAEYFKLAKCKEMFVGSGLSVNYSSGWQLPIYNGAFFTLLNSVPTSTENQLLTEFGKIFSINATIRDPNNFNMVVRGNEYLRFPFLPTGVTNPMMLGSGDWIQMPSISTQTEDLWYHHKTLEICVGNDSSAFPGGGDGINDKPSELIFDYSGKTYILKLSTTSTHVLIALDYL